MFFFQILFDTRPASGDIWLGVYASREQMHGDQTRVLLFRLCLFLIFFFFVIYRLATAVMVRDVYAITQSDRVVVCAPLSHAAVQFSTQPRS